MPRNKTSVSGMQSIRQRKLLKQRIQVELRRKQVEPRLCKTYHVNGEASAPRIETSGLDGDKAQRASNSHLVRDKIRNKSYRPTDQNDSKSCCNCNETYDDLIDPKTWSVSSRWLYTLIIANTGCMVSFASSVAAPTVPQAMKEYNISEEVALLACTVYFITFGLGTMVAAPLTEVFGRYVGGFSILETKLTIEPEQESRLHHQ